MGSLPPPLTRYSSLDFSTDELIIKYKSNTNSCSYLYGAFSVGGIALSLRSIVPLTFTITLRGECCRAPGFMGEDAEAQTGEMVCPRSAVAELGFKPRLSGSEHILIQLLGTL